MALFRSVKFINNRLNSTLLQKVNANTLAYKQAWMIGKGRVFNSSFVRCGPLSGVPIVANDHSVVRHLYTGNACIQKADTLGRLYQEVERRREVICNDEEGMLQIKWSRRQLLEYPYVWLRDNCLCNKCFEPKTESRLFAIGDLDVDIRPINVELTEDVLSIDWSDGHHSEYDDEWLWDHRLTGEAVRERKVSDPTIETWGAEMHGNMDSFHLEQILSDDQSLYDWLFSLEKFGINIITGGPEVSGVLTTIGERVGFLRKTAWGNVFQVKMMPNPINPACTGSPLALHTDLSYQTDNNTVWLLHSISQGGRGESYFVDGFNAANQLKALYPDHYHTLTKTIVPYQAIFPGRNDLLAHGTVIGLDPNGRVANIRHSNHSRHRDLGLPPHMVEPLYQALKAFDHLLYRPDNFISFTVKPGDIVCIDNRRVLHGRGEIEVYGDQIRHMEGAYLEWDEIRSRRRTLHDKLLAERMEDGRIA